MQTLHYWPVFWARVTVSALIIIFFFYESVTEALVQTLVCKVRASKTARYGLSCSCVATCAHAATTCVYALTGTACCCP